MYTLIEEIFTRSKIRENY